MIKEISKYFCLILFLGLASNVHSQVQTFNMQDTIVTLCEGILLDSDQGNQVDYYAHNENLTFTICPPGGVQNIILSFSAFCTEVGFDVLTIHAGQDTFGTVVGTYSGTNLPPTLTVTNCITLNFKSDGSQACTGWTASWQATMDPPLTPTMTINPISPTCSTATVSAIFSSPIHCDSITTGTWVISGPLAQTVVSAVSQNCAPDDSTTSVLLTLSPGLDNGGIYDIALTFNLRDACDSLWTMVVSDTTSINDCPIAVNVIASQSPTCPGECITVFAQASGGDSTTYSYSWNNGLPPTAGPHTVCPTSTTTYTCTVSDLGPSPNATGSVTVTVLPAPNAQANLTVCQSGASFNLTANPAGGIWNGTGITDTVLGTFNPGTAGSGVHVVYYTGANGCFDSTIVTVNPINAGPPQASCPGAAPFNMTGFSPAGGTWSGPNVSPAGVFNPVVQGNVVVTYSFGGCTDTKTVFVQPLAVQPDDTVCQSLGLDTLIFFPPGGSWSGSGITNAALGIFNTNNSGSGMKTLTYSINGCSATLMRFVTQINAGNNQNACPKQQPFNLLAGSPAGGYWTGPSLLDTITGLFDPGLNNYNWNAHMYYHFGGCVDDKYVWVRITQIGVDTVAFCRQDNGPFYLNYTNTNRNVGNGNWSGPGITDPNYPGTFVPSLAGPGFHTLDYLANGCSDSMTVWVFPPKVLTDTIICELSPPIQLVEYPKDPQPGGVWTGNGVSSPQGLFDPIITGAGTFPLYYTSFAGCADTTSVTVTPKDSVWFTGLASNYCYMDTLVTLSGKPFGGTWTGIGLVDSIFNPSLAGPGAHKISYTFGIGDCEETVDQFVIVGQPLFITATSSPDSICQGDFATINANAAGGLGNGYSFSWNQGLPASFQHLVNPTNTTIYIVTVNDGCTDPVADTLELYVQQPFTLSFDTSAIQCAGQTGFAVAIPSITGNFNFTWNTSPLSYGDTLWADVGSEHIVNVVNAGTDCALEDTVRIPGYPQIQTNFLANPSNCAPFSDPEFNFIDLSTGIDFGTWDFGDGTVIPYVLNANPNHIYGLVGTFSVTLWGENYGGCMDTISLEVCVEPLPLHIFNTFTPNGDGQNDFFEVDGLEAFPNNSLQVFNRYGQLVYQTDSYQNNWSGRHYKSGQALPDGAYYYVLELGENDQENMVGDVVIMR